VEMSGVLTLRNRVALVTGGSGNIGLAIAQKFLSAGMRVAILSRSRLRANSAARRLASEDQVVGLECDVSDGESVAKTLKEVHTLFGGLDVVVNSAALLDVVPMSDMTSEHWDQILESNLRGTFLVCQQALPYLEVSTAPRIINISSNAGRMGGFENGLAYSASKGGVIALTYGLARRLAPKRITVNCIAPGTIESDMLRQWDQETRTRLLNRFPIGRFGTSDEVAAAACYFASEEAGFTTGAVLDVNGGLFMG